MPVEGRDDEVVILTFIKTTASYFEHEIAAFLPEHAQRLIDEGVAVLGGPSDSPVNLIVPHASQENGTVNCTVGEWTGEPTSYAYAWQSDGADVGDGNPYPVTADDVGKTVTCVVTATNAAGATAAPPSNGVVVTEPPASDAASHSRRRTRS